MNTSLTIVARIEAGPGKSEQVKAALMGLIEPTRKEVGCIQYDLHQDNENPAVFLFYETWASRELWQAHMNAPHLVEYMKATEGAVISFSLNEMSRIGG